MVIFAAGAGSDANSAALGDCGDSGEFGFEFVCLPTSDWGSATPALLDRCLRLDAGYGYKWVRVFAAGAVSASAVVALRAAKRLWRNTKAMRG